MLFQRRIKNGSDKIMDSETCFKGTNNDDDVFHNLDII